MISTELELLQANKEYALKELKEHRQLIEESNFGKNTDLRDKLLDSLASIELAIKGSLETTEMGLKDMKGFDEFITKNDKDEIIGVGFKQ